MITSPNYPDNYPSDVICRYSFQGHGRERVQIVFSEFRLLSDAAIDSSDPRKLVGPPRKRFVSIRLREMIKLRRMKFGNGMRYFLLTDYLFYIFINWFIERHNAVISEEPFLHRDGRNHLSTHCTYPRRDGHAEWPWAAWINAGMVDPPKVVTNQSTVLTGLDVAQLRWCDERRYRYAKPAGVIRRSCSNNNSSSYSFIIRQKAALSTLQKHDRRQCSKQQKHKSITLTKNYKRFVKTYCVLMSTKTPSYRKTLRLDNRSINKRVEKQFD